MEWVKITDEQPPTNVWLEFFDGDKTMGHHPPFNHIDKINKRGEAQVNYIHNYTHWRLLTAPKEKMNEQQEAENEASPKEWVVIRISTNVYECLNKGLKCLTI